LKLEADRSTSLTQQIAYAEGLLEGRKLPEAIAAFDVAEQMGADADGCGAARWMAAMLRGDFAAAWRESDAIRTRGGVDPHRFWGGEEVRGRRVMVRCLHGFGDAIQFLRYMPRLVVLAERVIVEVPSRMVALAPMLDGVADVITWGEGAPAEAPRWDVQVEVMELPYLFRTLPEELPLAVEYLCPGMVEVTEAARVMGVRQGLRVGLVWASGEWNPERSMPVECMERLVRGGEGIEFWSLQGGTARAEAAGLVAGGVMRDAAECGDGLLALAAVIANLDLVVTVDTLAAHMTGAMGSQVWLLLQKTADWRWMEGRCDSPWYPSMRIFRQTIEGDWDGLVEAVRIELVRFAEQGPLSEVAR